METTPSARILTRSQAKNATANPTLPVSKEVEESEKNVSKSRTRNHQQERSALIDITNDSPIVGLAMGTPSSAVAKHRSGRAKNMTPGSGEALLRGQVKTLLQKVEEEAELSRLPLESRPFLNLQGFIHSPAGLLAPTPANTPQVADLSADASVVASPVVEEQMDFWQITMNQASLESQKNLITRSLLLDFSEKSESSSECSSVVTHQGVISTTPEEDSCSVWSIEVSASTDEEETVEEDEKEEELMDEVCEGMSRISLKGKTMATFEGKHKRFVYNSEGELEGEEEEEAAEEVMRLKGLPTPKGKHLRFPEEDD